MNAERGHRRTKSRSRNRYAMDGGRGYSFEAPVTSPERRNFFERSSSSRPYSRTEVKVAKPWIKEARLQERLVDGKVRCGSCERRCVIGEGKSGYCKTRINKDGRLYTTVYGVISSLSANPAEKKPFFHFWPGNLFLTAGTFGCTFHCPWCQNWTISQVPPDYERSDYLTPGEFIEIALKRGCIGTSLSFNEPTLLLEYALDLFPLAHKKGMLNTFVTNGYMTLEALRMLRNAGLDAINIDVKGDANAVRKYCGADVEFVWRNIREAKKLGMHVEVVNLVIPGINDDEKQLMEFARRHLLEAGPETPLHFTRYYPAYKFTVPPSLVKTLECAVELARKEGVEFAYIGNVPGHKFENTFCPRCNKMLIKRFGLELLWADLGEDGACPSCGHKIPIVGKIRKSDFK